jgi:hypothetical protein
MHGIAENPTATLAAIMAATWLRQRLPAYPAKDGHRTGRRFWQILKVSEHRWNLFG